MERKVQSGDLSLFWVSIKNNFKKRFLILIPFLLIIGIIGVFFGVSPYTPLSLEKDVVVERTSLIKEFVLSIYDFFTKGLITKESFFDLQIFFWFILAFFLFGGIIDYVGKKARKEKIDIQSLGLSDFKYFFDYYLVYFKIALSIIFLEMLFLLPYLEKTVDNFTYSITSFAIGNLLGVVFLIPLIVVSLSVVLNEFFG